MWKRYDPGTGLSLRDASIFYGDDKTAERFTILRIEGYEIEPDFDPWDQKGRNDFYLKNMAFRECRLRLETSLIGKLTAGTLFATGCADSAPLDQPAARIIPDRWRTLTADFENSSASAPGLIVIGILVFHPRLAGSLEPGVSARAYSRAELTRWYKGWVTESGRLGRIPSRDEDWREAARVFGRPIPREAVRALRRELAPAAWVSKGRRKGNPGQ